MVYTDQKFEVDAMSGIATVEWSGTGPSADVSNDQFQCTLDGVNLEDCELTIIHNRTLTHMPYTHGHYKAWFTIYDTGAYVASVASSLVHNNYDAGELT